MKKVEEKFGNKAHYNSEREPIHFTALPFGFFRVFLSLSVFFLVWVHSFDFIIVFIALYFRVSNWLSSPKQKAHFNFIILFVPPARTNHPPSPLLYNPLLLAFSIEISHKKGIKAEASVDCELLFWHFFKAEHALPHLSCLCPCPFLSLFPLRSTFFAFTFRINKQFFSQLVLCLPSSCRHT